MKMLERIAYDVATVFRPRVRPTRRGVVALVGLWLVLFAVAAAFADTWAGLIGLAVLIVVPVAVGAAAMLRTV
ncbi:hypothetical protein ND748_10455 [Frankia sp. AiPs1]|uniref:hypothetical protein n=1 Tax=Frankia sp. AiPs1 TaxID=573493 RepID=UPI00204409C3|nr:hypothetical protein [Frankia sp. AiPs1]MCM3922077.1 hypothetical protein [Frankia sp. AiPs1]